MDTRRLEMLVHLAHYGSMRAVAQATGSTTSTVSQQIAALAREVGTPLVEPDGRRVQLTPAGRRLADASLGILAGLEQALHDLEPDGPPSGVVRVASFASAFSRVLVPTIRRLARDYPGVSLTVAEYEPTEALELLAADRIDLALTYDYNLAPARPDPRMVVTPLWTTPWSLAVPEDFGDITDQHAGLPLSLADAQWIVNSRGTADESVIRVLASIAGFEPRITHQVDSLHLVEVLVSAGLGVGLLRADTPVRPGVRLYPLVDPPAEVRSYAVARRGHSSWAPLALVIRLLGEVEPPGPSRRTRRRTSAALPGESRRPGGHAGTP